MNAVTAHDLLVDLSSALSIKDLGYSAEQVQIILTLLALEEENGYS
jgi:hypothetical protein